MVTITMMIIINNFLGGYFCHIWQLTVDNDNDKNNAPNTSLLAKDGQRQKWLHTTAGADGYDNDGKYFFLWINFIVPDSRQMMMVIAAMNYFLCG